MIAIIPARAGSKSIPQKNTKIFCGRPLVYWVLRACQDAPCVDEIVVALDSEDIANVVNQFGFSKVRIYERSPESATDYAASEIVLLEILEKYSYGGTTPIALVQATSPTLSSEVVESAYNMLTSDGYDSVLSCVRSRRFYWAEDGTPINYDPTSRPRRQDMPGTFVENGAIYVSSASAIKNSGCRISGKIGVVEMDDVSIIELDEPKDWTILEALFTSETKSTVPSADLIEIVMTDVDGTLTDAGMYYGEMGDEYKKFNTHDGMAFELLKRKGITSCILTSESTELVARRAKKVGANHLIQGLSADAKLAAAAKLCDDYGVSLRQAAYIGDDRNCIPLLKAVGFAACPSNAQEVVKRVPGIKVLGKSGGDGAFREMVNLLLEEGKLGVRQ